MSCLTLEITSATGNKSLRLWQGQEDMRQVNGNTDVMAPVIYRSDEVLLTQLESRESFTLTGITTGNRLADDPSYVSDPHQALADWVARFEEFLNGTQGSGHELSATHRNLTVNGAIRSLGWEYREGAKYEVRWDLEFIRGNALMEATDTSPDSVSPTTAGTIDNFDIGRLDRLRCEKSQQIESYPVAFANPGENELLEKSGVVRKYTLIGTREDTISNPDDERDQFDDHIRSLVGQDQIVDFNEPFPGRTKQVMVDSFESTRESGVTRIGQYALELIEGVA